jgi:hypothetical protein
MRAAQSVTSSSPVQEHLPQRESGRRRRPINDYVVSERFLLIVSLAFAAVEVWINRYSINGDGVSYLDVGDTYFRGNWAAAINGYWSPLYSWLLGLALYLIKPSIWWELITVHLVNLIIYIGVLFSFRFFLHSVLRAVREETDPSGESLPLPEWILSGLGYGTFLWASLVLIGTIYVTPDLLVAGFLFLIGGYLVQLRLHESYGKFAMFGILIGLAYLGKAIMFPLGFGLLAILMFSGRISRRRACGVLLSTFLFLMVCCPFIAALSKTKGRFTYGDVGRLNYAAMVSPNSPAKHWQGDPTGSGVPKHPTRELLENPAVFEFAKPVADTYPPWYDASYWNEGVQWTFRLRSQIRVLVQSALKYSKMVIEQLGLVAGILIFILWGGAPTRRAILSNWPLIAAASLSIGIYSLVLVTSRYVGGSVVLLFIAILAGIRLPRSQQTAPLAKYVAIAAMVTILFSVAVHLAETAYFSMTVYSDPMQKDQMKAAEGSRNMGLKAGDPVAIIGDGTAQYWARLGRFKIVAEAFSPEAGSMRFWSEPPERRKLAYECLGRAGAKVVVAWNPPESARDASWRQVATTNYYVQFLTR